MNVEKLSHLRVMETNCHMCRVCGSDLWSCTCGTVESSAGIKRPTNSLQAGGHTTKRIYSGENRLQKTESQPGNYDDKLKAMKRDSGKCSLQRRFNDVPAVVPFKKRRILISRSPSPPTRSPSPQTPASRSTSPQAVTQTSHAFCCITPSAVSSSPLIPPGLSTWEQSASLILLSSAMKANSCLIFKEGGKFLWNERDYLIREGRSQVAFKHHMHNKLDDLNPSPEISEGELVRSESGSFSKDDRLHWDLNTDMDAWDAATEHGTHKISEEVVAEIPCRSTSRNSDGSSHDEQLEEPESEMFHADDDDEKKNLEEELGIGNGVVEEEPESGENVLDEEVDIGDEESEIRRQAAEEEPKETEEQAIKEPEETGEQCIEEAEIEEQLLEEEPEMGEQVKEEETREQGIEEADIEEQLLEKEPEMGGPGMLEQVTPRNSPCREASIEKEQVTSPMMRTQNVWNAADYYEPVLCDGVLPSDQRDGAEHNSATHSYIPDGRFSVFEKQLKLFSDDGEGWNHVTEEPELEEHVDYDDSDLRDADDMGVDVDDRTSLMQEESNWKGEEGSYVPGPGIPTVQEGEASDGETLVAAGEPPAGSLGKRARSRTTGWDQLPEGFDNAEEALRAVKDISSRRGRGASWSSPRARGSLPTSLTASGFGFGSARGSARDGFSSARSDRYFGDRHPDEILYDRDNFRHGRRLDDSFGAHNTTRGRDLGRRPGLFGRGRVGGWIDSQPGHVNQYGTGRNRPSSGFGGPGNAAAVAVEKNGFMVGPDGRRTEPGSGAGLSRGMRSTWSGSRSGRGGHALGGPPVDTDAGVQYPLRERVAGMNVRGRGLGMHNRAGQGLLESYRGGDMNSRMDSRSASLRRPHPSDHSNMVGRVTSVRPESRAVRPRTPPSSYRSVGHSEFSSARSQRSPPWSEGNKDRDFRRTPSRSRVSSQRTSSHINGSSLTDERDQQVLLKGSEHPASVRKLRDGSLESRRSKRSEEEDTRQTGSLSKDGDYRRANPTRDDDKERERDSPYRIDRDRDRDDERRRDSHLSSNRDGRFTSGHKHASTREIDDDVAPRRRRPS